MADRETIAREGRGQDAEARYSRYRAVIDPVVGCGQFVLADLQRACQQVSPSFVTRVVNELVKEGWLIHEPADDGNLYRWNNGRGEFQLSRWLDDKIRGSQIKQQPHQERPREKLLEQGAGALQVSELLAILIRCGVPGESAIEAGEKIARHFDGKLERLPDAGKAELRELTRAINVTAWCQIMAGIELGRRIAEINRRETVVRIETSRDAIQFCETRFSRLITDARQEEFHIVTLDTKNQVIDTHQITVGTLDASLVHPREVFKKAIRDSARSIILVHNHPSGDPTPSKEDFQVTARLDEVSRIIGIDVLDHIVLGAFSSVSIRESAP